MILAAYMVTGFLVASIYAVGMLKGRRDRLHRLGLLIPLTIACIATPIQLFVGDMHGLGVLKYQPTKLAAIEGNWDRQDNMPLRLFAIPDEEAETNHYEIAIPKIGSWLLTHAYDGVVPGLKDVPRDQRPPVWPVFFSFRIMVGIGLAMLAVSLWSVYLRWKGTLFTNRLFLTAAMLMTPTGFGAVLFGWFTAEIGRQPWVVYGHLRTADAVSPVSTGAVATSLVTFFVVYLFVFGFGTYYLVKLLRRGPDVVETMPGETLGKMPKRPLSMPSEGMEGAPGHRAPQPAE